MATDLPPTASPEERDSPMTATYVRVVVVEVVFLTLLWLAQRYFSH